MEKDNENRMAVKQLILTAAVALMICAGFGCATAEVKIEARGKQITHPDFVLVHDFQYNAKEIKMDSGIVAQAVRDADTNETQTEQELAVGKSAAKALTSGIVDCLNKAGIKAYSAASGRKPTANTLVLKGKFIRISQGNRAVRVLVGFGFGNGDIKALAECTQDGQFIARALITTFGSLKPGLAVPIAGAGSSVIPLIASSAAAGGSELLLTTVEADANRAAKKIAEKIVQGYINHGWAPPDAINKMNALF